MVFFPFRIRRQGRSVRWVCANSGMPRFDPGFQVSFNALLLCPVGGNLVRHSCPYDHDAGTGDRTLQVSTKMNVQAGRCGETRAENRVRNWLLRSRHHALGRR